MDKIYSNPERVIGSSGALRNSSGVGTVPRTASHARVAVAVTFHMAKQRSLSSVTPGKTLSFIDLGSGRRNHDPYLVPNRVPIVTRALWCRKIGFDWGNLCDEF